MNNDCIYCMNLDYCLLLFRCCIGCENCSQYEKTDDDEQETEISKTALLKHLDMAVECKD